MNHSLTLWLNVVNHGAMAVDDVVARNMRGELARFRLTQEEAGKILGLSQSAMGHRLRALRPFTVRDVVVFSVRLGIPLSRLLEGVEEESS